jgi:transcription-repair coupling factor (superfamily II helicase)
MSDNQNQTFLVPKSALPEKAGDRRNWGNACGSGFSLSICHAALAHEGLTLVIAPDTQTGLQIEQDVSFFSSGNVEILSFPDWETLPYDSFSPHQDIVSQRISTLYKLPQISRGVLVVP